MSLTGIFIVIWVCLGLPSGSLAQESRGPLRLTLEDALQKADVANLQVMMSNARLEQAIYRLPQARADLLPHIEGVVSGGRQTADLRSEGIQFPGVGTHLGPYNNFDARGRVTVALFDPAAFERFEAAKKGEHLSRAQSAKLREDVLALVADLFIDAQRREQSVGFLHSLLEKDQLAYDLSEARYAQGTGTLLEVNKLKSDLDQTRYLYQQAKVQALDACLDLEAALQLPLGMPLVFIDGKSFLKRLDKDDGTDFQDAPNADVALAAAQVELAQANQKTALADFLPKISGSAEYGRAGASPDRGSNTYDVGLAVSVPIWEGGLQQARLMEVKGQVKEAQENLLDTSRQSRVKIAKARAAIKEARDLIYAKTAELKADQRALRIALHSLQIGSGSVLETMQAKADLALAEDEYNEAQADWVMSHIDLFHAQGRLGELVKE